jgi:hypothetical protein
MRVLSLFGGAACPAATDCQEFRVQAGGCTSGHGPGEALAEDDGELGLGDRPLAWGHGPLFFGPVQDQEQEL